MYEFEQLNELKLIVKKTSVQYYIHFTLTSTVVFTNHARMLFMKLVRECLFNIF